VHADAHGICEPKDTYAPTGCVHPHRQVCICVHPLHTLAALPVLLADKELCVRSGRAGGEARTKGWCAHQCCVRRVRGRIPYARTQARAWQEMARARVLTLVCAHV